jgi:hypothetical protein
MLGIFPSLCLLCLSSTSISNTCIPSRLRVACFLFFSLSLSSIIIRSIIIMVVVASAAASYVGVVVVIIITTVESG